VIDATEINGAEVQPTRPGPALVGVRNTVGAIGPSMIASTHPWDATR